MKNFLIGMIPIFIMLLITIVALVRSVASQYGYKFFITPVSIVVIIMLWVGYWFGVITI